MAALDAPLYIRHAFRQGLSNVTEAAAPSHDGDSSFLVMVIRSRQALDAVKLYRTFLLLTSRVSRSTLLPNPMVASVNIPTNQFWFGDVTD